MILRSAVGRLSCNTMPEEIKINKTRGVIEVHSYGKVTKEDSLASLERIAGLLKEPGVNSILVDVRKQAVATPRAANVAAFAAKLPKGVKIAMLYSKDHPNDGAFTYMTATAICNSVSMRMFDSREAALEWLAE